MAITRVQRHRVKLSRNGPDEYFHLVNEKRKQKGSFSHRPYFSLRKKREGGAKKKTSRAVQSVKGF